MPSYNYKAKSHDGEIVQSWIEADTRQDALSVLHSRGISVLVDLQEASKPHGAGALAAGSALEPVKLANPILRSGRITLGDKAIFCRQLAISVGAGVALRDALEAIADDMENLNLRKVLRGVNEKLDEGKTFSEALAHHRKVFPPIFVALVRTAEEAGSMPQTLEQLAESLEKTEKLTRKIQSITAYPLFVAVFFCLICSIMTLFVLPQFERVFSGWNATLPLLTRVVFSLNRFFVDHFVMLAAGVTVLVGAVMAYGRLPAGRLLYDRLTLKFPLLGVCVKKLAVARFCRNLAIMIRGGVPIATAIEISAGVCGNKVLENSLLGARDRIISGSDISTSMAHDGVFPRLVIRMVSIGESSGRLPEVLDRVSDGYENEVEGLILVATSLFEPIIICFFGVVVLVLVLAIYMPVFTVASHVK